MEPREMIALAKAKGLSVLAVSDHNTAKGWHEAETYADDSLLIVPAVEYATDKGHILALFIEKELPEEYLIPIDWFHYEHGPVLDGIHACGGLAFFAHPFKAESRDPMARDIFEGIDGIEVINSRAAAKWNLDANRYAARAAEELGLPFSCGSDAHVAGEIGNVFLELEVKELTLAEVRRALLERQGTASGKDTYCTHCAVSAFHKLQNKKWKKKMPKGVLYLLYSMAMDLGKMLRILPKNRFETLMKEGKLCDTAHQNRKKS